MSYISKNLAKEVLSKYPCAVEVVVNPYYYQLSDNGSSICGLGIFQPSEIEKLSNVIEQISSQIYNETGFYITSLEWLDIFPEDESLLSEKIDKEIAELACLLS